MRTLLLRTVAALVVLVFLFATPVLMLLSAMARH